MLILAATTSVALPNFKVLILLRLCSTKLSLKVLSMTGKLSFRRGFGLKPMASFKEPPNKSFELTSPRYALQRAYQEHVRLKLSHLPRGPSRTYGYKFRPVMRAA